jgi:hypothetical protein
MSFKPTPTDLWESRFGIEPPFSLGVEEELLLVDPDNQLADQGARIVREANPAKGDVDRELFKAMVESRSEISANVRQAIAALREIRRELVDSGIRIMGVGVHPDALPGEGGVHQTPRYALIEDSLQGVLRTPICGQHIHVGMPDAETAVRAYNGVRVHVPLLNALAANSPFWFGDDSGLASSRTVIFRSYPRSVPPAASRTTPTSGGTLASTPGLGRSRSARPTRSSTCVARPRCRRSFIASPGWKPNATSAISRPARRSRSRAFRRRAMASRPSC